MDYSQFGFAQMQLNKVLRQIRKSKNMSQQTIADILGIDRSTYSYYETGKSELDIKTLLALCEIFNVTLDEMLNQDEVVLNTSLVTNAKAAYHAMQDETVPLSQYEQRLLQYIRLMDDRQRSKMLEYATGVLEHSNEK